MREKILIADDEPDILNMLDRFFTGRGYQVIKAANGAEAARAAGHCPDVILLDVNMPDMDGMAVCRAVREHVSCPIIFLTARVEEEDKLKGFAAGGDDYVVKPFSLEELAARVAAHIRRERRQAAKAELRFEGGLALNYTSRQAFVNGNELGFAKKEFDILEFLSTNPGMVFDKERIYESVWGWEGEGDGTVVAEHVRRIRAKLSAAGAGEYIETVWGCGYRWIK